MIDEKSKKLVEYYDKLAEILYKQTDGKGLIDKETLWSGNGEDREEVQKKIFELSKKKIEKNTEVVDEDTYIVSKLVRKENFINKCEICNSGIMNINDDVMFIKYNCCYKCYIRYIEGREDKYNIEEIKKCQK